MPKFLTKYDFYTHILEVNLDEISESKDRLVNDAIDSAVEETAGYIRHRYDFTKTFAPVYLFDVTATYVVDTRIIWTETDYLATSTYTTGDLAVYNDKIYEANQNITTPEAFDIAKWDLQADNNSFYQVILESTGNLPINTTYFTAGDARNSKLVQVTADIMLYHFHARISPRNIPDLRRLLYDGDSEKQTGGAIGWLKMVQKGIIDADLEVKTDSDGTVPQSGERVSYGQTSTAKYKY